MKKIHNKKKTKHWDELLDGINKHFKENVYEKREVDFSFTGNGKGDEIQLYIEGLGNVYNKERDWRWDIFLNKDGTWHLG
jgi:hypothetical protein